MARIQGVRYGYTLFVAHDETGYRATVEPGGYLDQPVVTQEVIDAFLTKVNLFGVTGWRVMTEAELEEYQDEDGEAEDYDLVLDEEAQPS